MKINTQALTTLTIEAILDGMREALIGEQAIAQAELEALNASCVTTEGFRHRIRPFTDFEKEQVRCILAQSTRLSGMLRDVASASAAASQGRLESINFEIETPHETPAKAPMWLLGR